MNEHDKPAAVSESRPAPEVRSSPDVKAVSDAATATLLSTAELYVTDHQGQPVSRALSERERWLATQADAALRRNQTVVPGAVLQRLEVNGLLPDADPSYLYLCYQQPGAAALEFWASYRREASLDLKRGRVGVASAGAPT